jgi:RHS repeat-associated protein
MIGANTGGALTTQTWSPENRMLSLQKSDGTNETYLYSDDGLRKEKTNTSGTTIFTWDEQNVLLETNTSGVIQARNTDFPGFWGGLTSQNRAGVSSFYGYDSQGSARILTSILGAITDYYVYMAFGVELSTGLTPTTNPNRYLALYGYYRDFINWMYVRARILDALKGRWVSRARFEELHRGEHSYGYALNNPATRNDPSGLRPPKGCQSQMKDAMKSACKAFASKVERNCVIDCIDDNWSYNNDETRATCLQAVLCSTGKIKIIPNGSSGCKKCSDPCGETVPGQGTSCTVGICEAACADSGGCSGSTTNIRTIIHESLHCCESGSEVHRNTEGRAWKTAQCIVHKCL